MAGAWKWAGVLVPFPEMGITVSHPYPQGDRRTDRHVLNAASTNCLGLQSVYGQYVTCLICLSPDLWATLAWRPVSFLSMAAVYLPGQVHVVPSPWRHTLILPLLSKLSSGDTCVFRRLFSDCHITPCSTCNMMLTLIFSSVGVYLFPLNLGFP